MLHLANVRTVRFLVDDQVAAEFPVEAAVVDAVMTASRSLIAVAMMSLGAAADETTMAQYRTLVVLASRGPQRIMDLAGALDVAPSTAGRMCDRLVRKGLIRRYRARADRRVVLVSVTAAGRDVVDQATARRRELIAAIMSRLPAASHLAVAEGLRLFAAAAGEVPDSQWPAADEPSRRDDLPDEKPAPLLRQRAPASTGLEP